MTYKVVSRRGKFAIIRQLSNGDVAGYDRLADAGDVTPIIRQWPGVDHIGEAFNRSRRYSTREAAIAAMPRNDEAIR